MYKTFLNENEEDKLVNLAKKWLANKFGDRYEFIHKANLSDPDKT